ncbi:hypothetical protein DSY1721 [Desulfitobacterium hafniense Y51]|uniref:Uncharacterized protein n=1 Tax=Desulfitobacterium hafniense (strain Y51) TaxID=138119 RepID=Q24WT2_DESHY|nr:hypothetical protein DSY1721 [Desulfitobacterium hafniense Y51]
MAISWRSSSVTVDFNPGILFFLITGLPEGVIPVSHFTVRVDVRGMARTAILLTPFLAVLTTGACFACPFQSMHPIIQWFPKSS